MKQTEFYACLNKDRVLYKIKRVGYTKTFVDYSGTEITFNCYKYKDKWFCVESETGCSITPPQKTRERAFTTTFTTLNNYAINHNRTIKAMVDGFKKVDEYKEYKGEE